MDASRFKACRKKIFALQTRGRPKMLVGLLPAKVRSVAAESSRRAYCAFRLKFLAHNCSDLAPFLMARGNHRRRFARPECLQMMLDRSLEQLYLIDDLFDHSKVLQLLPACLESACFQIL